MRRRLRLRKRVRSQLDWHDRPDRMGRAEGLRDNELHLPMLSIRHLLKGRGRCVLEPTRLEQYAIRRDEAPAVALGMGKAGVVPPRAADKVLGFRLATP